jgi:hypothetical protein
LRIWSLLFKFTDKAIITRSARRGTCSRICSYLTLLWSRCRIWAKVTRRASMTLRFSKEGISALAA